MANRPASFTQADVTRALKGAVAAGMTVKEAIATADGVRLVFVEKNTPVKSTDTWADVQ